ncbi:PhnE/PtxC family ABC transporter permease [Pseudoneobacillus rhizosphaerae]|uniref:Phosphate-import permease protein PhnE n=1 Tax=Pseudoneobacillus rhizosphaerae TaxID=2880968 RepID=A0A9C7G651_9BACI|nr:ABC transporter permease subunit [Pseudoneobacillus rhizosphaerae]CAG9606433.1 Phosphate-import permease protein PhnE [Pseudoneobacillus rhizosphaerae]
MMHDIIDSFDRRKRFYINLLLILIFLWSLTAINWNEDLVHPGGGVMIIQILKSILQPNLSFEIIQIALESTWITVVYAVAGMTLAILYGSIAGVLASGILTNNRILKKVSVGIFRGILSFTRAIHELVWAWLFVASFGLSPYAAIFALAIPYGGILGRILADALNDVPKQPIQALKLAGASNWKCLFYGYLPFVWNHMLSYTLYRFECAIRSSTIMSFVGLGGLGYQIQLSLADLKFDEVWTFLFFLILLVVIVDLWSGLLRNSNNSKFSAHALLRYFSIDRLSIYIFTLLVCTSWYYVIFVQQASLLKLFSSENAQYALKFFTGLLGLNEVQPAFLNFDYWKTAIGLTWETLLMSVMAIGIATIVTLLTVIPAARNFANGTLTASSSFWQWLSFGIIRIAYIFSRAVPELIWAMLIVFLLQPGLLPGALALALHNFGILGKLCAEVIEEMDHKPVRNLSTAGANKAQMLLYGVLPMVMPKFLSYIFYRWEVIMRTTIVVGFIGAGGLGQEFKLSMSFFHYSEITLLLFCYLILVFIADFFSEWFRKAAK